MGDHSHISMELDEVSLCCFNSITRCITNFVHGYHFHILVQLDQVSFIAFSIAIRWLELLEDVLGFSCSLYMIGSIIWNMNEWIH